MQETAERVEGPGDARAGRVDALGDAARSVEALAQRAGVGRVDLREAAGAVAGEGRDVAGGVDRRGEAARGVVGVGVDDGAVGEELLARERAAEAVLLAAFRGILVGGVGWRSS
jgi:hypothetical protein